LDAAGNAYFAGNVGGGAALPATPGVVMPTGSFTGFAAKVTAAGTGLAYLTYLPNDASGIALDTAGDLYLAAQNVCAAISIPPSVAPCSVLPSNTVPSGVVLYVGAAPGIVAGVSQFNVEIYTNAVVSGTPGPFTFIVSGVGASVSQTVWVEF